MKLYVVKMERYGDYDGHAYIIGIYSNIELASINGKYEKNYRGNKYYPNIIEVDYFGEDNQKLTLISTWKESPHESVRSLEFKIVQGSCSPEYNDDLLKVNKMSVHTEYIIHEGLPDDFMLECNSYYSYYPNFFSNEEWAILRDLYERYIRNIGY